MSDAAATEPPDDSTPLANPPPPSTSSFSSALSGWSLSIVLLQAEALMLVGSGAALLSSVPLAQLLGHNAWPSLERNRALGIWAVVAALVFGGGLFIGWRWGQAILSRIAHLALPLIPLALFPLLLCTDHWFHHQLEYLVLLGVYGFIAEACLNQALCELPGLIKVGARCSAWLAQRTPWLPLATVITAALLYAGYTGYLTVLNHHRFGSGAFDLGIFDNVMFNSLKGHPFRTTIMFGEGAKSFLLSHSPYLLYTFLPIYAIHPAAETLLWIQAGVLGSGAIVLFFFARTQVSAQLAAAIALLYLLWAPMHGAQFYDFHWLTIAPAFVFFLFYALAKNRASLIGIATLLLWLLREDLAPGLALLGVILLLSGVRPKAGLFLALASSTWFALNKFVIMPSFGEWWFANLYEDLTTPSEKGYGSVVKTLLTNPLFALPTLFKEGKLVYLLHLLVPLALIPARRLKFALLIIPGTIFTVLTHAGANFSIRYQYSSHYSGYLFSAVVLFFRDLSFQSPAQSSLATRARSLATLGALALCMLCHSTTYGVVLKPSSFIGGTLPVAFALTAKEKKELAALDALKALIPAQASVTATTKDSPHLSNRLDIYAFGHSRHPSEYLLINPGSFGMGPTNQDILATLDAADYGLVKKESAITLWKRGLKNAESAAELKRLRSRLGGARRSRP